MLEGDVVEKLGQSKDDGSDCDAIGMEEKGLVVALGNAEDSD